MAKSQRSKVMRRWRALKREHVQNTKINHDLHEFNAKLEATIQNRFQRPVAPKNMFLHPNDPTAQIPKIKPQPIVDFRSQAMPYAGTQFVGAHRKAAQEEVVTKPQDEEVEQEIEMDAAPVQDEADELANAMGGVRVKSKREIRKENKAKAMEEIIPLNKVKKIKKSRRKDQQTRKSKKLITF